MVSGFWVEALFSSIGDLGVDLALLLPRVKVPSCNTCDDMGKGGISIALRHSASQISKPDNAKPCTSVANKT